MTVSAPTATANGCAATNAPHAAYSGTAAETACTCATTRDGCSYAITGNCNQANMEYKVTAPGTLLPFLLEAMAGRSRSAVKSCLTHGRVSVNGCRTTRHDTPLRAGDTV